MNVVIVIPAVFTHKLHYSNLLVLLIDWILLDHSPPAYVGVVSGAGHVVSWKRFSWAGLEVLPVLGSSLLSMCSVQSWSSILYTFPASLLSTEQPHPCAMHGALLLIDLMLIHLTGCLVSRVGQNKKSEWKGDKYLSTENVKCLHLDDRFLWFFFLFIYSNILTIMYFLVEVKYL